jgi:hypothetical protein
MDRRGRCAGFEELNGTTWYHRQGKKNAGEDETSGAGTGTGSERMSCAHPSCLPSWLDLYRTFLSAYLEVDFMPQTVKGLRACIGEQ